MTVDCWYVLAGILVHAMSKNFVGFFFFFVSFNDGADLRIESFSCKQRFLIIEGAWLLCI